jgi:Family of unknown function (DUF6114)
MRPMTPRSWRRTPARTRRLTRTGAAGTPRGGWFRRARLGFRGWRRTRPFWGGLIALLGGIEILLSERAPVAVVVHLGAQGLAGYVVPVVLVLCALLLWFNPAQRIFYSILAVLAALASFITSNLGGFVLGMLLGIVGGSLAFAWVPGEPPRPRRRRRERPIANRPSEGLALVVGERGRQAVAPHGGDAETGPAGDPETEPAGDLEPGPGRDLEPGPGRDLRSGPGRDPEPGPGHDLEPGPSGGLRPGRGGDLRSGPGGGRGPGVAVNPRPGPVRGHRPLAVAAWTRGRADRPGTCAPGGGEGHAAAGRCWPPCRRPSSWPRSRRRSFWPWLPRSPSFFRRPGR